jgi:hypothetical protein
MLQFSGVEASSAPSRPRDELVADLTPLCLGAQPVSHDTERRGAGQRARESTFVEQQTITLTEGTTTDLRFVLGDGAIGYAILTDSVWIRPERQPSQFVTSTPNDRTPSITVSGSMRSAGLA